MCNSGCDPKLLCMVNAKHSLTGTLTERAYRNQKRAAQKFWQQGDVLMALSNRFIFVLVNYKEIAWRWRVLPIIYLRLSFSLS